MIPQGNSFLPFIKLPNIIDGTTGEIDVGEQTEVITEFHPPENAKIKNPFIGNVKLPNGQERTVGLNWTSYSEIAKDLGRDTTDWIGKVITYAGMKKMREGCVRTSLDS